MSIATRRRLSVEGSPRHQQKKVQQTPETTPSNCVQPQTLEQQTSGIPGKSIVIDNQQKPEAIRHATKNSKLLTKQTPVGSTESEDKSVEQEVGEEHFDSEQVARELEAKLQLRELNEQDFNEIKEKPVDYQIYQDGKVNDFFNSDTNGNKPKSISDVCLVNDHFILVKMPSSEGLSKAYTNQRTRKMCHQFHCKRKGVRKIAPINEESEDIELSENGETLKQKSKSSHCLNVTSCWSTPSNNEADVEVYYTQTKIRKIPPVVMEKETQSQRQTETDIHDNLNKNDRLVAEKPLEIQSISGRINPSSLGGRVALHNQVSVVNRYANSKDIAYCSPPRLRTCPRFERFYWLLRPFRGKYRRPKPKIQAVVYKTYFVKWTKPPEVRHHGYGGVRSTQLSDMDASVLRRCRSAIF